MRQRKGLTVLDGNRMDLAPALDPSAPLTVKRLFESIGHPKNRSQSLPEKVSARLHTRIYDKFHSGKEDIPDEISSRVQELKIDLEPDMIGHEGHQLPQNMSFILPQELSMNLSKDLSQELSHGLIKSSAQPKSTNLSNKHSDRSRQVEFGNVPIGTSMSAILSQVSGGPLERVAIRHRSGASSFTVVLYFLLSSNANEFYNFARAGRFLVNGVPYVPHSRQPVSDNQMTTSQVPKITSRLSAESKQVLQAMHFDDARRALMLTCIVDVETAPTLNRNSKHRVIKMDVSMDHLQRYMELFGTVVSLRPALGAQVMVFVEYSSTRAAIAAKTSLDSPDGRLRRHLPNWRAEYGRDPTDRNCPELLV